MQVGVLLEMNLEEQVILNPFILEILNFTQKQKWRKLTSSKYKI